MKTLRSCLRFVCGLLLVIVLFVMGWYALLLIINRNEAALSEEAQHALLYALPVAEQLEDNGFLILAGLDAPWESLTQDAAIPAYDLGRQRLKREIERYQWTLANPGNAEGMPSNMAESKPKLNVLPAELRCPPGEADCFAWYQARKTALTATIHANHALIQRLNAAATAKQFNNPFPVHLYYDLSIHAPLIRSHELWLAQAALQWVEGQQAEAITKVATASRLRSRLAQNPSSLVTSMTALAMQARELHWLSNAAERTAPAVVTRQIEQLLAAQPHSLHAGLESEKRLMASIYYTFRHYRRSGIFSSPWDERYARWQQVLNRISATGFLPNETTNQIVKDMATVQRISDLPAHEQESAFSNYMSSKPDDAACQYPMLPLRNQMGRCISAVGTAHYLAFMQRVNDIEGYRRLVLLQRQALVEGISPAAMPAWLDQSPVELRNPYTRQAMEWDAGTSSLVFEGKEKQNQNSNGSSTYRVRLFTPAI